MILVSHDKTPGVLEPGKKTLDLPATPVAPEFPAILGWWLLPSPTMWRYQFNTTRLFKFLIKPVTVVGLIAEHMFGRLDIADQLFRHWAVVRFATRQENGDQASLSICQCMNLRVAPAARAADSLLLLPPFPPLAERCALMWVESII